MGGSEAVAPAMTKIRMLRNALELALYALNELIDDVQRLGEAIDALESRINEIEGALRGAKDGNSSGPEHKG